jgi:predicted ATPase
VIKRVEIQNFRCIRQATIDLGALTVLVGPNACGKTTVLAAINPGHGLNPSDAWMKQPNSSILVQVTYSNRTATRRIDSGNWVANEFAHSFQLLHLDVDRLRSPNQVAHESTLSADGHNLANVFGTLTRKQQAAVADELCRLVPVFSDLDLVPIQQGTHTLRFQDRWDSNVWYLPNEVSDGTMLIVAFLMVQHQRSRPDIVAIEEPDRGLHPYLVSQVVALLRKLSVGEVGNGKAIQILLATHSAELLDYVQPEEVRFLSRDRATGALQVYQVDPASPDWKAAYDEYRESLGSVWLSGGLGGVPGE